MKIFQFLENYLAILGIEPLQSFQKNHSTALLLKRLLVFILFITWLICIIHFAVYEAKTIDEYADAFYITVCLITILSIFPIILWKMDNLFEFIKDLEDLIEQRKKTELQTTLIRIIIKLKKWYLFVRDGKPRFEVNFYQIEWKRRKVYECILFLCRKSDRSCNYHAAFYNKFLSLFCNL